MDWSLLAGLIWCGALGLAAGNMACSLVYRLPRGEPLFVRKPFCSHCETPLATADLFPLFSYLFLRGRCRYCREPIPFVYTAIEIMSAVLFCLSYLRYGFSDAMALVIAVGISLMILACIEIGASAIHRNVMVAAGGIALLLRILWDQTIFDFLFAGFYGFVLLTGIWWIAYGRKSERQRPSPSVWLMALLPAALAHWGAVIPGVIVAVIAFALTWMIVKRPLTAPAIALGILFPLLTG